MSGLKCNIINGKILKLYINFDIMYKLIYEVMNFSLAQYI